MEQKTRLCPLNADTEKSIDCTKESCAFYCDGEGECAIKVVALQLIKLEEIGKT